MSTKPQPTASDPTQSDPAQSLAPSVMSSAAREEPAVPEELAREESARKESVVASRAGAAPAPVAPESSPGWVGRLRRLDPSDPGVRAWFPRIALVATVVVLGTFPLMRTPNFYFWDDSAAVFLPTWRTAGMQLWSGGWPGLRPDFWMGGAWAVEAQFGLWSPVNLVLMMISALLPDLIAVSVLVKLAFQLLLATGVYALAREYGARPWFAWAVASAIPFAGFTLYFDTATWIAGLMAFAWTPWFWWATRRCARGALNPLLMFAVGYLLITNGNPYGALAAVIVLLGVGVETLLARDGRGLARIVLTGALVGATAGVAYLPLVLSSSVGWRESTGVFNTGDLVPDLSMLAGTSAASQLPFIRLWSRSGTTIPMAYSAWFLTLILPWLPWSYARAQARRLAALWVVFGLYLALALGPSNLWLFRWPVRLMQYTWLPLFVLVAVLLSHGVVRGAWRVRAAVTLLIAAGGSWLAYSSSPWLAQRHGRAFLLSLALAVVLIVVVVWFRAALAPVLVAGTALVLAVQLYWSPSNQDVAVWDFPSDAASRAAYADRYRGPVIQVADPARIPEESRREVGAWLLFGSMPGASGVESTTSYTGIGFNAFSRALCMNHAGATCGQAMDMAFAPAGDLVTVRHLVDAVKANTVVVQRVLVPQAERFNLPAGWSIIESNEWVVVFGRDGDPPYPGSRLAAVSDGVAVASASGSKTTERITVSTGANGGALQFARLAWPGYSATVNGEPVDARMNTQGLIEVPLPGGLADARVELTYRVPGYGIAVPLLIGAVVGATALGVWSGRARMRGDVVITRR